MSGFAMQDGLARMRFAISVKLDSLIDVQGFPCFMIFLISSCTGSVLLSTAYIWSQLLSCDGM